MLTEVSGAPLFTCEAGGRASERHRHRRWARPTRRLHRTRLDPALPGGRRLPQVPPSGRGADSAEFHLLRPPRCPPPRPGARGRPPPGPRPRAVGPARPPRAGAAPCRWQPARAALPACRRLDSLASRLPPWPPASRRVPAVGAPVPKFSWPCVHLLDPLGTVFLLCPEMEVGQRRWTNRFPFSQCPL